MYRLWISMGCTLLCVSIGVALAHGQTLSVNDAVLLAVRMHPNIKNARLDRVVDRFNLAVAHNQFWPQYTLSGTSSWAKGVSTQHSATAAVGLKTALGTGFSVNKEASNTAGVDTHVGLEITQPLLRGFGSAVNTANLVSAQDQVSAGQLTMQQTLIDTINHALSSYWALMQAEQDLKVQTLSLAQTTRNLKAYKIKVRVGQMARSSLDQQKTVLRVNLICANCEVH